jgi:hypothetical protein
MMQTNVMLCSSCQAAALLPVKHSSSRVHDPSWRICRTSDAELGLGRLIIQARAYYTARVHLVCVHGFELHTTQALLAASSPLVQPPRPSNTGCLKLVVDVYG